MVRTSWCDIQGSCSLPDRGCFAFYNGEKAPPMLQKLSEFFQRCPFFEDREPCPMVALLARIRLIQKSLSFASTFSLLTFPVWARSLKFRSAAPVHSLYNKSTHTYTLARATDSQHREVSPSITHINTPTRASFEFSTQQLVITAKK